MEESLGNIGLAIVGTLLHLQYCMLLPARHLNSDLGIVFKNTR